jgi:hypothetical protein
VRDEVMKSLFRRAEALLNKVTDERLKAYVEAALNMAVEGDYAMLARLQNLRSFPVPIDEFIEGKSYMNTPGVVYPPVMEELLRINSGQYVEVVFTGGIGSGKSTAALYTTLYQLYLIGCLISPHREYRLDPASEIEFIFQNITSDLAKDVTYDRFRAMVDTSPYFTINYRRDTRLKNQLHFPNRVIVKPLSGTDRGAIGQNVMGGIMEELNYMKVVRKSKKSLDSEVYDQAIATYNSIARRRKSRFLNAGSLPGILCLVSSRRYPGQFTDRKEDEAKVDNTIYVYDKCVWDVKPSFYAEGGFISVFVGDENRKPRLIEGDDYVADEDSHLVRKVPAEFKRDFEVDLIDALREIAGVSTLARYPFIGDTERVSQAFGHHPSIFLSEFTDFNTTPLRVSPKNFINPQMPRFAHVDLGLSSDSAGVAIGHIARFIRLDRGGGVSEYLPEIIYDGLLEVRPPKGGEIQFHKIRALFIKLKTLGLNIKWITYDSFQSVDSVQLLSAAGFVAGNQSMDTSTLPYEMLKSALYDARVKAPKHQKAQTELVSLERDKLEEKIDHPSLGSKDVSDAMGGVAYGLMRRRQLWSMFRVPARYIPPNVDT